VVFFRIFTSSIVTSSVEYQVYGLAKELVGLLDLRLAWMRLKHDIEKRVFIGNPYTVSLIDSDLDGWLEARRNQIKSDAYSPSPMSVGP
jgi:hypothetical protein